MDSNFVTIEKWEKWEISKIGIVVNALDGIIRTDFGLNMQGLLVASGDGHCYLFVV